MFAEENLREIVNGKLLQQFNGKKVSLTGLVTNVQPNGMSFEMMSVDDISVKVNLKKPNKDPIGGYVEVIGISHGTSIACEEIIKWDTESEFDVSAHNTVAKLLNSLPNLWKINNN